MNQGWRPRGRRVSILVLSGLVLALAGGASAQVKIEVPAKNSVVSTPFLHVRGTVVSAKRNIGVSVNEVRAVLDLDHAGTNKDPFRWAAVVEAPAGRVKLKARLHDPSRGNGQDDTETAANVVHVDFAPAPRMLELEPVSTSGITPLDITFHATVANPANVTRFEIDYDGNGTWDRTAASIPEDLASRYATPGIRLATARVTMSDGTVSTATTVIHAQTFQTTNALLKEVWGGFRQSLASGNLDAVMPWFAGDTVRAKYRRPLETIRTSLPSFAAAIATLDAIWIREDVAHYLATRMENGRPTGYHVYFARDDQGLWKVLQF